MHIQFLEDTYIRKSLSLPVADPIGIVYKGVVLEVEEQVHVAAFTIENNNRWYRDHNGWYYWSGGAEAVPTEIVFKQPHPPPEQPPPGTPDVPPEPPSPLASNAAPEAETGPTPVAPPGPKIDPVAVAGMLYFDLSKLPDGIFIPEGETRYVPGNMQDAAIIGASDVLESVRAIPDTDREDDRGIDHLPHTTIHWSAVDPAKINWGIRRGALQQDWWQDRRLTGRGVKIALIGTGADLTHPDLNGTILNFFSTVADSSKTFEGQDNLGTQTALIAAGCGWKNLGVAPEADLLIARVGYSERDITPDNLLAGVRWALDHGADVIAMLADFRNLSDAQKIAFKKHIDEAAERKVVFVAPVGHSNAERPQLRFPAALNGVLAVGAHDFMGKRSAFSAKSYRLDILAPGEGLAIPEQSIGDLKTSTVATAFTAGFLALVCQWQRENDHFHTPAAIFEFLRSTADTNGKIIKGDNIEYGHGILNPAGVLIQLETK